MKITTKQFQILTDINLVWDFLVETYDREKGGGVAAPFFEYAVQASWFDKSYLHLDRFWLDDGKVVGFVFYENPVTDIFFKVRPGYEYLIDEMMDYAMKYMPNFDSKQQFVLLNGQELLMEAAVKRGFKKVYQFENRFFDFENELNFKLPKGFHFVVPSKIDPVKLAKCCWYGFNHGDKGEFENWELQDNSNDWTPQRAYKGVVSAILSPSPHSTSQYDVVIADENEEYACYSGMWWVKENKLAYMEPLCTVPEYRKMGLASAALSKHYHTMKALGATHMTGGDDPFYEKLGYGKGMQFNIFNRE